MWKEYVEVFVSSCDRLFGRLYWWHPRLSVSATLSCGWRIYFCRRKSVTGWCWSGLCHLRSTRHVGMCQGLLGLQEFPLNPQTAGGKSRDAFMFSSVGGPLESGPDRSFALPQNKSAIFKTLGLRKARASRKGTQRGTAGFRSQQYREENKIVRALAGLSLLALMTDCVDSSWCSWLAVWAMFPLE